MIVLVFFRCWDAEILTSYGWIEAVGCADRSAFDLKNHAKATGIKLCAEKKLEKPRTINIVEMVPNKGVIGKAFKREAKSIIETLSSYEEKDIHEKENVLESFGEFELHVANSDVKQGYKTFQIDKSMVSVRKSEKVVHVEEFVPSVVEPSFGIGRIMYGLFEHSFCQREGDEQRTYLALPPIIAPYKCSVLPLSKNEEFVPIIEKISKELTDNDIAHKVDDSSGSIGRRYARTDEISVPYGITVDFDTIKIPNTVTLRERDSMDQVRIPLHDAASIVKEAISGKLTWKDILNKYPKFEQQEAKSI